MTHGQLSADTRRKLSCAAGHGFTSNAGAVPCNASQPDSTLLCSAVCCARGQGLFEVVFDHFQRVLLRDLRTVPRPLANRFETASCLDPLLHPRVEGTASDALLSWVRRLVRRLSQESKPQTQCRQHLSEDDWAFASMNSKILSRQHVLGQMSDGIDSHYVVANCEQYAVGFTTLHAEAKFSHFKRK